MVIFVTSPTLQWWNLYGGFNSSSFIHEKDLGSYKLIRVFLMHYHYQCHKYRHYIVSTVSHVENLH